MGPEKTDGGNFGKYYGTASSPLVIIPSPVLLIHGGAGAKDNIEQHQLEKRKTLEAVLKEGMAKLRNGSSAIETVALAVKLLEASPHFNAGLGSALQDDGLARLTASIMDSERGEFSAVLGVTHIIHPSELALALQGRKDRVFGALGGQLLARELGIKPSSPITDEQIEKWLARNKKPSQGTVGAVALDVKGNLAACTSTGGKGQSAPDRLPDVGTIAGNYASPFAAISCTGIGEEIVDDAVAPRIETRVRDGVPLLEASEKQLHDAIDKNRNYAWIALDKTANWVIFHSTPAISAGICILKPNNSSPEIRVW